MREIDCPSCNKTFLAQNTKIDGWGHPYDYTICPDDDCRKAIIVSKDNVELYDNHYD